MKSNGSRGGQTSGQIPFDLAPTPNFDLTRFEVGDCNRSAFNAVSSWPNWPSPILLLVGPAGAGKTHLGQGWARKMGGVVWTSEVSDFHNTSDMNAKTVVFFDKADDADETQLFTQMNLALNGQVAGLLLAARSAPQDWDIKIKDLRSRLVNTPAALLSDHDDDILEPIIRKLFEDMGRVVRADVVQYLIKHEDRSVDVLRPLIAQLDHAARSAKRDLTRAFTSEYLRASKNQSFDF